VTHFVFFLALAAILGGVYICAAVQHSRVILRAGSE
jgi:hypothetical protein